MSDITTCNEHYGHEQLDDCSICLKRKVQLLEKLIKQHESRLKADYDFLKEKDLVINPQARYDDHVKGCERIGCRCSICPCTCLKGYIDEYCDLNDEELINTMR